MPGTEFQRVETLRALNILDTPPELDLDELAQLAGLICKTPIALISLVDTNRQWFKAKIGLAVDQTPRSSSFCSWAIEQNDIFIIPDATRDPRFAANPLVVADPHIRFYAGTPLITRSGYALGTLCVIDSQPRTLEAEQVLALRILAKQVVTQIEKRQSDRDLTSSLNTLESQRVQIVETQKLSSLGEMAAALAHEINNPLTVIYGRAIHLQEMAAAAQLPPAEVGRSAASIVQVTERLMRIVKGLRNFARSGDQDPIEACSASEIIESTLEFCRQKFKESSVDLRLKGTAEMQTIYGRPVQVSQIILNLLNNAYDAIKNQPQRWVEIEITRLSDKVSIAITDSGQGIAPVIQAKIFQPFFTTKDVQHGTGLGLSISRRMANDQGGDLIYEASNGNTRFVLTLPTLKTTDSCQTAKKELRTCLKF